MKKNECLKLNLFPLQAYIEDLIKETPTGGHYDIQWWKSRYTDMEVEKYMKTRELNPKLDFSLEDFFNEVFIFFHKNKLATYFLKEDYEKMELL